MNKKPYGVLMLHGFPTNTDYFLPLEPSIIALGLPYRIPLLRGHGSKSPEALLGVTWHDWLVDAESALTDLLKDCEKVVVIGYSVGGALTLMLAAKNGEKLDSIILVAAGVQLTSPLAPGNPFNFLVPLVALFMKKWDFTPGPTDYYRGNYLWAPKGAVLSVLDLSKTVRTHLAEIKMPALLIQSHKDGAVAPESMDIIYNGISTPAEQKRMIWFEKTGHDMFYGCERDEVIDAIAKFVRGRIGIT